MRPPALDVRMKSDLPTGTYFADWALPEARQMSESGYSRQTLTTTLDSRLQNIARRVTSRAPLGEAQVALVAMRTNGEVVAMIGGKDYEKSPFNRATQAKRQTGFDLQAIRLPRRAARRVGDRRHDRQHRDHARLLPSRAITAGAIRTA